MKSPEINTQSAQAMKQVENMMQFKVNEEKCTGCGLCVKACPSMLIYLNDRKKASVHEVKSIDWYGCWGCQHCLAVCPEGAISVFGKKPEDSLPVLQEDVSGLLDALIAGRRSCRHFQDRNVDRAVIDQMLKVLENAPTGGNKQMVEYTIIDDKEEMKKFQKILREKTEEQAAKGIYPRTFDEESYRIMVEREQQAMNGDMLFCSAPHLFIAHVPGRIGSGKEDVTISSTYFELMCAARKLGAVILRFPLNILDTLPEVKALLQIPEDHHIGVAIGFGYPEFPYARGVQKEGKAPVHRLTFE